MKNRIQIKQPDLELPRHWTDEEREAFHEKYAEFGEYYIIELDTRTLECRLLPKSEWKSRNH